MRIAVALKPHHRHVDIDPLTGAVTVGGAPEHAAPADLAALETALRLRDRWGGTVTAAAAGDRAAEPILRDALARGADYAVLVGAATAELPGAAGGVARTAELLAGAFGECDLVICGDYSPDGGTGAVPALLAAASGRAQALGLVSVRATEQEGVLRVERRLDQGRRERLLVRAPAVLSVEGSVVRPRRASLPALLAARTAPIDTRPAPHAEGVASLTPRPYRPRARVVPAPTGQPLDRVRDLLGTGVERQPPRLVRADPAAAAQEIVDQLSGWGYL